MKTMLFTGVLAVGLAVAAVFAMPGHGGAAADLACCSCCGPGCACIDCRCDASGCCDGSGPCDCGLCCPLCQCCN